MKYKLYLCLLMIGGIASPTSQGETKMTLEEKFLVQLAFEIRMFELKRGIALTNWNQLGDYMVTLNTELLRYKLSFYPFETHYFLLTNSVPMIEGTAAGNARVIGIEPVEQPDRGTGRYVIHGDTNGLQRTWLSEEKVQRMLRRADVTLPEPGTLPLLFSPKAYQDEDTARRALEVEVHRILEEDISQQKSSERPVVAPATRVTPKQPRPARPVPERPKAETASFFFQWVGIGMAGLIGLALVIALLRAAKK